MSGATNRIVELEALAAAKDAVIAEQAKQLAALETEARRFERLVAELTEMVGRSSMTSSILLPRDVPDRR